MVHATYDKIKLGVFVIAGGLFLVIVLYMIGRKENLFGSTFMLKARFQNVQGLVPGNNVRFSGIQIGTVKSVKMLNDTVIEVTMRIETSARNHLRSNATASIGTEGLIGNKVVNIITGGPGAPFVKEDDILSSHRSIDPEDMLRILDNTNKDIGVAAARLKSTMERLNSSTALWRLLNDESLPNSIAVSAANIRRASHNASAMTATINEIVNGIKEGKGSLGSIITDTSLAGELQETLARIQSIGDNAAILSGSLKQTIDNIDDQLKNGQGTLHLLLSDSSLSQNIRESLRNVEEGTSAFNQNMEALKHNILFRGYFRKLEREKNRK